jgi:hypothetical protein
MISERSQILALFAARRIDLAEAERLLVLVGGRDRFLTLALWMAALLIGALASLSQFHFGDDLLTGLHSALRAASGSEAVHHIHVFFIRLLGELP